MMNDKTNKKLLQEIDVMKSWMKFLDNTNNYNKSFHKPTANNPKLMNEGMFDNDNDQHGSPEETSSKLILGNDETVDNVVNDGSFIVISTDINGGIHVSITQAEDENQALEQNDNEMITQTMVIPEDSLMVLISKLTQYIPEELNTGEEYDKPPFIDESDDDDLMDRY